MVLQASKDGGSLPGFIERGGARVRNWEEAEAFVDDFEKLVGLKVWFSIL